MRGYGRLYVRLFGVCGSEGGMLDCMYVSLGVRVMLDYMYVFWG